MSTVWTRVTGLRQAACISAAMWIRFCKFHKITQRKADVGRLFWRPCHPLLKQGQLKQVVLDCDSKDGNSTTSPGNILWCLTTLTVKQLHFFCSSVISCVSICTHWLPLANLDKLLPRSDDSAETPFRSYFCFYPTYIPNLSVDCWVCSCSLFFGAVVL